jgi:uncharacterized protein (DUF433 family)
MSIERGRAPAGIPLHSIGWVENSFVFDAQPQHIWDVMPTLESTLDAHAPLSTAEGGTIRIADTRVSLDSVVHLYQQGATAEEIALRFPALRLADIHSCLAYYLNHQEDVQKYMTRHKQRADELQQSISSDPAQQRGVAEMRERIKKRMAASQQNLPDTPISVRHNPS